eukprot:UN13127
MIQVVYLILYFPKCTIISDNLSTQNLMVCLYWFYTIEFII